MLRPEYVVFELIALRMGYLLGYAYVGRRAGAVACRGARAPRHRAFGMK